MKWLLLLFLEDGGIKTSYVDLGDLSLSRSSCEYVGLTMITKKKYKVKDYECKLVATRGKMITLAR